DARLGRLRFGDRAGAPHEALRLVDADLLLGLRGAEEGARGRGGGLVRELGRVGLFGVLLVPAVLLGELLLVLLLLLFHCSPLSLGDGAGVAGGAPTSRCVIRNVKALSNAKMYAAMSAEITTTMSVRRTIVSRLGQVT